MGIIIILINLYFILNILVFDSNAHQFHNKSAAYISGGEKAEDFDTISPGNPTFTNVYTTYSTGFQGDQKLCPGRTSCTLLTECRLLADLMDKTCLIPARLRELICGYVRNEPMVCCPPGGNYSPFRPGDQNDGTPDGNKPGLNQQTCGRPQLNGWQSGYSGLGSQPWAVRVGFKNSDNGLIDYPCCGSLITSKVVLTGAHCALLKGTGRALHSVRVGEYDTRDDPDCTNTFCGHPVQNILVSHVIVHPGFERTTFRHDVALIILKESANFSLSVQPICLLRDRDYPVIGRNGRLVGWGKIPGQDSNKYKTVWSYSNTAHCMASTSTCFGECSTNDGDSQKLLSFQKNRFSTPPKQQQLDLPIIPPDTCTRLYSKVIPITNNHLCVGGEAQRDACSGFGGAPLVVIDHIRNDRYYQVGMVSFGSDKCGASGVPSVYTNIAEYYTWIASNIP